MAQVLGFIPSQTARRETEKVPKLQKKCKERKKRFRRWWGGGEEHDVRIRTTRGHSRQQGRVSKTRKRGIRVNELVGGDLRDKGGKENARKENMEERFNE